MKNEGGKTFVQQQKWEHQPANLTRCITAAIAAIYGSFVSSRLARSSDQKRSDLSLLKLPRYVFFDWITIKNREKLNRETAKGKGKLPLVWVPFGGVGILGDQIFHVPGTKLWHHTAEQL